MILTIRTLKTYKTLRIFCYRLNNNDIRYPFINSHNTNMVQFTFFFKNKFPVIILLYSVFAKMIKTDIKEYLIIT